MDKDASFSVHHRNIQTLAIEIYKHIIGLSPAIMEEVFKIDRTLPYNRRAQNDFSSRVPKTVTWNRNNFFFSSENMGFSPRKTEIVFLFGSF